MLNTLFNKVLGENKKMSFIFTEKPKELFGQPNTSAVSSHVSRADIPHLLALSWAV